MGVRHAFLCRLPSLTCFAPDISRASSTGGQRPGLRLADMLRNVALG
jgi:hypothetical protein